ncbi:multiple sugar transport system substrate-binding protein [Pullulanibacillus pueri]|uniref:Sugar ABC transporter substrate-binding protein n=1 Tax=Pullulanibacillus pueri TaxID=1437324 RepID=A0A8J3ENP3_9BACL|nr:ABC transporter substrate-binding protein [Pullulanibacillus pueri]MBM7683661.1 multiple sugar transport system substrate-binding protein [Pullulanibacillus pueri]GGH87189.1 sugar ABC transporter substrate-binding protein [Pullulanibacillus pueri]
MKRKSILVLVSILLILTVITGCSSNSSGESNDKGVVTLNFWYGWAGSEGELMEDLISEFNKTHDKIKVKGLSESDYQKQLTAISGGNPPDIASQFGDAVVPWGVKGAMTPLDDYIKKDNVDLDDFIPGALEQTQYEGKTYAIPIAMHIPMLLYNKDLLKKADLNGPPQTISDLKEYADKLTVVDKSGRIERLGFQATPSVYSMAFAFGGQFWDPDTKEVTPDNEGVKEAVKLGADTWKKYGEKNINRFQSGLGKSFTAQDPFFVGKLAMAIEDEYVPTFIKKYAPKLNYGIAPIPYDENKPDLKNPGDVRTSVFYIPKGASHPDQAWTFLNWLVSKDQMVKFTAGLGNLPTRKSALSDSAYDNIPGFKEYLEYSKSENLHSFPALPISSEYTTELTKEIDAIDRGKLTIDAGLKKVKEEIQPLVKDK